MTLVERLVSEFTGRGYKISTIKHAHHTFDIDHQGTDSYRHREAGAIEVALVSGCRWALMHELHGDDEPPLEAVLNRISPCDLVLVEGYKQEARAKIEARRSDAKKTEPLTPGDPAIVTIAADHAIEGETVPVLDLNDISAIADFIIDYCRLPKRDDAE